MDQQTANTIGLSLGIIGVVLIFFWGPPQPILNPGVNLELEDATPIDSNGKTVADQNRETEARKTRHAIISGTGLVLIAAGFLFQLLSTWI